MLAAVVLAVLAVQSVVDVSTARPQGVLQSTPTPPDPVKPEQPWPPAGVFRPGAEVTLPKLIKDTKPNLASARFWGTVVIEAVVRPDGTVGEVRVMRSLDKEHGLDDEAVKTVKEWQFLPGKKDGIAVPVVVEVEMTFVLTGMPKPRDVFPPKVRRPSNRRNKAMAVRSDFLPRKACLGSHRRCHL